MLSLFLMTAAFADPQAPAEYRVLLETTAGDVVIKVDRSWAPAAADRFHLLVSEGFYDGNAVFRVLRGYIAQWGLSPDPETNARWLEQTLSDEAVVQPNKARTVSFAAAGENSRRTQVFVNLGSNTNLDSMGFAPFGKVVKGYGRLKKAYSLYGDGPDQTRIRSEGDTYLDANFPRLDRIERATILPD